MTVIAKLQVQNVRSHEQYVLPLAEGVTVITGANGSGKTSLLEALYIILQGTSFKSSDADVLRSDAPWWRIDIETTDGDKRSASFDPTRLNRRKQFVVDGKTSARLVPKYKYPVVLFEPEDLRLLNGSPVRRRDFIDTFIGHLNPLYGPAVRKYERALKQRNNLLKREYINRDELFAWEIALSEHGAYIIEQRIAFIEQLNAGLADAYNDIAHTHDDVSVHYSHTFVGDIKQKLINELHAHYERDRVLGNTSVGPHRHDVIFKLNGSVAMSVASRGEVRTIVLALKFLEVDLIERLTGLKPIILLDDVFSELDADRQNYITKYFKGHQIVITSATTHLKKGAYEVALV